MHVYELYNSLESISGTLGHITGNNTNSFSMQYTPFCFISSIVNSLLLIFIFLYVEYRLYITEI